MPNETAAGVAPLSESHTNKKLPPWWRRASLLTMALGFSVLILLTVKVYHEAPPIPGKVAGPDGSVPFTGEDIRDGQQVFLKYGLMDSGTIWGHGALLGPRFLGRVFAHLRGPGRPGIMPRGSAECSTATIGKRRERCRPKLGTLRA
jgi:nitric oxide reductase subunit B